jgi:ADP-heptose:LPS heptosyltransferase
VGEVSGLFDWEGPEVAALLAGQAPRPGPLEDHVRGCQVVLAYTRSASLIDALRHRVPRVVDHDPNPRSGHASRWLADPVRAWGADPDPLPPPLTSTSQEEDAAASLLRALPPGFLALHPGSGAPAKTWPTDRFLALAAALSPGRPWLLVRGPAESAVSAPPGAVVAHELPLRVLGAVLARAGLFVGNDSGVSHLAAAAGAPTLSLFGPTAPEVWSPLGPRVVTLRAPGGAMSEISVDEVAAKAAALR